MLPTAGTARFANPFGGDFVKILLYLFFLRLSAKWESRRLYLPEQGLKPMPAV